MLLFVPDRSYGCASPAVGKEKFRIVSGTALMAVQQTASLKKAGSLYGNRFQSNVLKLITR